MNVHFRAALLAAILLPTVSCSGGGGGGGGTPSLVGVWQYVSGPSLLEEAQSFGGGGPVDARLAYLDLTTDGSGTGHASAAGDQVGCANLIFAVIDENVVRIDVPDANINRTFRYTVDQEQMTLVDENGATTVFSAATAVPAAAQCVTPTTTTNTPLARRSSNNTSLVSDGTNLYYYADAGVVSLTIATLATNATITTLGTYGIPLTMQGADFWGSCNCGNNSLTERRTAGGALVDSIDMDADLNHLMVLRGGAFDGTKLWLTGFNFATNASDLVRVGAAGEPDLLEAVVPLGFSPRGLVFDGTSFWTTTRFLGPMLISFDSATGSVTRSIELPPDLYYDGVVVIGQDAYLLATDYSANYSTVLIHVSIPN